MDRGERTRWMEMNVEGILEANAQISVAQLDYWKQDTTERMKRDFALSGASTKSALRIGQLMVLRHLHIEESELNLPISDEFSTDDIVDAVRRARSAEKDVGYWEHIKGGGILSFEAWKRYEEQRAALYARPDDKLTDADWKAIHQFDLALGY